MQRNNPEPLPLGAEMVGREEIWEIALLHAIAAQPDSLGRAVGQLLNIHQPVDPAPGGAMPNIILLREAQLAFQKMAAARSVDYPAATRFRAASKQSVLIRLRYLGIETLHAANEMKPGIL